MISYSGSLVQQNFGESNTHGILKWDVKNNTNKFIPIESDYGFRTVYYIDNILITVSDDKFIELSFDDMISQFPKNLSLRIKNDNSDRLVIDDFISKVELHFNLQSLIILDIDSKDSEISNLKAENDILDTQSNITQVSYQNELIKNMHSQILGYDLEDDILQKIFKLNDNLNKTFLQQPDTNYGSLIKLKEMTFNNMFSYGTGNYINFDSMNGIVGLFAPNRQGKSSIMQILLFLLYDKSSKTNKTLDYLNINTRFFDAKLTFEVDNETYIIEKNGKLDSKDKLHFTVNFYKLTDKNVQVSLNGEQRRETVKKIRAIVGTYENIVMTNIVLQQDDSFNFIRKTQTERRVLLNHFIGLDIFQQLHKSVQSLVKESKVKFNLLLSENIITTINKYEQELKEYKSQLIALDKDVKQYDLDIKSYEILKTDIQSKIKNIDVKDINVTAIKQNIQQYETFISDKTLECEEVNILISQLKSDIDDKNKSIIEYDVNELTKQFNTYNDNVNNISKLQTKLRTLSLRNDTITQSLGIISKFEYDTDNCDVCLANNKIQSDGLSQFNSDFSANKQTIIQLNNDITKLVNENVQLEESVKRHNNLTIISQDINELNSKVVKLENHIKLTTSEINTKNEKLLTANTQINQYNTSKNIIEQNQIHQTKLNDINSVLFNFNSERRNVEQQINQIGVKADVIEEKLKDLYVKRVNLEVLEQDLKILEYYSKLYHHTGIPFQLLSNVILKLNTETNKILSQITNFTLDFEMSDTNINIYICYGNKRWLLELNSGMENFISNIAVRMALSKITTLPKTEFMFVDEGWASLDKDNITKVSNLFDYLKQVYKYVIIVSHIDTMKDDIDMPIDITKENEFSKIIVK